MKTITGHMMISRHQMMFIYISDDSGSLFGFELDYWLVYARGSRRTIKCRKTESFSDTWYYLKMRTLIFAVAFRALFYSAFLRKVHDTSINSYNLQNIHNFQFYWVNYNFCVLIFVFKCVFARNDTCVQQILVR